MGTKRYAGSSTAEPPQLNFGLNELDGFLIQHSIIGTARDINSGYQGSGERSIHQRMASDRCVRG